ncbi:porin [Marinobacter vinifirmus]|uniref:Porin n=1 Tax=Marinobacter vinifirmus TaxID=355591 RepID=A0A7Z1DSZ9_9GAMM|nr:porin [Marinobacter vinifirmus]OZC35479.1 porin [Marinobacter vinifirmus]
MKKTILASAIAAATFSGAALAQESNLPTVYGNIQYALTYNDVENEAGQKFNGLEHFDNGTTLGVAHEHEIAPGIKGFLKLELEGINADDKSKSSGIDGLDEAYIGVQGDNFGKVWVGSDDSLYERNIVIIGNFHEVGSDIFGNYDTGEGDLIQYESPSFGGLTLGAAVQVNGDSDTKSSDTFEGRVPALDENGNVIPGEFVTVAEDRSSGDKSFPYQLAATYEVDALKLAFAMDSNDGSAGDNENSYGLSATYGMDDLTLIGEYQTRKDDSDIFGVMGVYTLGANQFALAYQMEDDDVTGDKNDTITIQALHNLSSNMYVYVEGYISSADADKDYEVGSFAAEGDERSTLALGAVYYF